MAVCFNFFNSFSKNGAKFDIAINRTRFYIFRKEKEKKSLWYLSLGVIYHQCS